MLSFRAFARYWLPVLLFMAAIFSVSGDRKSMEHSSRLVEPVLRWLLPGWSDHEIRAGVFVVRKFAHFTEYAVLYLLVWRALRHTKGVAIVWSWRQALVALTLVGIYAISDEFHQTLVPSRQGSPVDVLIDLSGATAALLVVWGFSRTPPERTRELPGVSEQKTAS